jgi:hypothetical protein
MRTRAIRVAIVIFVVFVGNVALTQGMVLLIPPFLWFLPFVLTLMAWRTGLHTIAATSDSETGVRTRTWPILLLLACPAIAVSVGWGLSALREIGHIRGAFPPHAVTSIMIIVAPASSVAALMISGWAPRRCRLLAFSAAAAWVAAFGMVLYIAHGLVAAMREGHAP